MLGTNKLHWQPEWAISIGLLLSAACISVVMAATYRAFDTFRNIAIEAVRIERLKGEAMRLDEILTMSARMANTTGDVRWRQRYMDNLELSEESIRALSTFTPIAFDGDEMRMVEIAHKNLVAMEKDSFRVLAKRDVNGARLILESEAYDQHRKVFARNMTLIAEKVDNFVRSRKLELLADVHTVLEISAFIILLTLGVWFLIIHHVVKWRRYVMASNAYLDAEVHRRTVDLRGEQSRSLSTAKMAILGEMASGIAHEINNPLSVIRGYAELIYNFALSSKLDSSTGLRFSKKIVENSDRISKIVTSFRKFSRDGSADPLVPCPVKCIVDDAVEMCRDRVRNAGVLLDVQEISDSTLVNVRATEICQILMNLIGNAVDSHESTLDRHDAFIRIGMETASDGSVTVIVSDNGPGIPKQLISRISQPFFTTKPEGKGTGLGLSISRSIMERHGGVLHFTSEPKGETVFSLQFPACTAKGATAEPNSGFII